VPTCCEALDAVHKAQQVETGDKVRNNVGLSPGIDIEWGLVFIFVQHKDTGRFMLDKIKNSRIFELPSFLLTRHQSQGMRLITQFKAKMPTFRAFMRGIQNGA
jgi:hypothetical protein